LIFFALEVCVFRPGAGLASGLDPPGLVPVLVPVQHLIWSVSVATSIRSMLRKCPAWRTLYHSVRFGRRRLGRTSKPRVGGSIPPGRAKLIQAFMPSYADAFWLPVRGLVRDSWPELGEPSVASRSLAGSCARRGDTRFSTAPRMWSGLRCA